MFELSEFRDVAKFIIPLVIVILLQIVKALLKNRNIKLKNEDTWVWIVLILGLPMAGIHFYLKSELPQGVLEFIWIAGVYAALSAMIYKVFKVGGKSVYELFLRKKE